MESLETKATMEHQAFDLLRLQPRTPTHAVTIKIVRNMHTLRRWRLRDLFLQSYSRHWKQEPVLGDIGRVICPPAHVTLLDTYLTLEAPIVAVYWPRTTFSCWTHEADPGGHSWSGDRDEQFFVLNHLVVETSRK